MKPSVRKNPVTGHWEVNRPGYGFTAAAVTPYATWTAALQSLKVDSGSGAQLTERNVGGYGPGLQHWTGYREHRPRWIESTDEAGMSRPEVRA